jgi:hypothetical protein
MPPVLTEKKTRRAKNTLANYQVNGYTGVTLINWRKEDFNLAGIIKGFALI